MKILFSSKSKYLVKCYGGFYLEGNVGLVLEYMNQGSLNKLISLVINNQIKIPEKIIARITFCAKSN